MKPMLADDADWAQFVLAYVQNKAKAARAFAQATVSQIEVAVENDKGYFSNLMSEVKSCLDDLKEAHRKASVQIVEAKSLERS